MKRLISSCVLALSGTAFLSSGAMAADPAACQNVRMGVVNWTDVIATSAMTQVLLDGLGYKTKQTSASQQIIFAGIRDQRLDLFLGYWNPLMTQTITPFVDAKQVKVLDKPSLEDARATLAVPTYLADKGLKTFADIAKFKRLLTDDVLTKANPSHGRALFERACSACHTYHGVGGNVGPDLDVLQRQIHANASRHRQKMHHSIG